MINESDCHWFPMRIRHSSLPRLNLMLERFEKQKEKLQEENILLEAYAPLRYIKVNANKMDFAPYLLNYIFVHSTYGNLLRIKSNQEWFEPLRFVMHPAYDERLRRYSEVVVIPDKTMEDYRRIADSEKENVLFLKDMQYAIKPSQLVQIIEGPFTGVIGRVKRVQGKRCVVLTVGDRQAAAIVDVHKNHLRYLTEAEAWRLSNQ
ncbi:MAG: hypothetical protein IJ548_03135 [Paludibacteraceae bacterium]|nr:hypothetical protein [Paludibacteraceae bacterium]MBQ9672573.1 hypothetical protein [Prevotella sp.]